ncbi:MAG: KEOPS complex subunit Pcc1 [Hadesarchaea archaeon]|nr:KEOPS complex subunit Pcc1 [Hadesarchaea archaeon]
MRLRAEVICVYGDERVSKAVTAALGPDNLQVPEGLRLSTKAKARRLVSVVELEGRIETLLATLDDLLACTITAESMI